MELALLAVVFVIIAAFIAGYLWSWNRTGQWPKVQARVERCEPAALRPEIHFNTPSAPVPGIRLYYSFSVDGSLYGGHFAEIGFSLESQIEEFIGRFGEGATVTVRYDPKNPDSSVLLVKDNLSIDIGLITGAPFIRVNDEGAAAFTDLKL